VLPSPTIALPSSKRVLGIVVDLLPVIMDFSDSCRAKRHVQKIEETK
jgi:hypothetical protein